MAGLLHLTALSRLLCLQTLWFNKVFSELTYLGCYVVRDNPSLGESLEGVDECLQYCDEGQHVYAGMWKRFCLCATKMDNLKRDDEGCTIPCAGNGTLLCGGPQGRISVYEVRPVDKGGLLPIYVWCLLGGAAFVVLVIIIGVACARRKLQSWDDNKPDPERRSTVENAYDSLPSRRTYRYQQVSDNPKEDAEPIVNSKRPITDCISPDGETEEEEGSTELETAASVYDLTEGKANCIEKEKNPPQITEDPVSEEGKKTQIV